MRAWFAKLPNQWVVASTFVLALFMDIIDLTIVNTSLVEISRQLKSPMTTTTWIVLGYSLSLAVWIPVSGWVGDRFGSRRTFIFALVIFVGASLLCSEARTIEQLIFFRVLQGIGGGMLTPVGTAMLFRAFPPEQRARASTILSIPTVLAPASGPVLGGLLTDTVGWRWVFRVNVPVGFIALLIAVFGLRKDEAGDRRPFDVVGFLLAASGFPAFVYFLERGAEDGWGSAHIIAAGGAAVVALVGLVVWSLRHRMPMLDLRLLQERLFATTNFVSFVATMSFLGIAFILPQYLQRVVGLSALESGLTTFPQAVGAIVMTRMAGRLYGTIGPRRMLLLSYAGLSATTLFFLFVSVDTNLWLIRAIMFGRGLFLSFSFIPLQAASYARISPADTGRASAIYSTQRQLAGATGIAVLSTVLLSTIPTRFGESVVPVAQQNGFTSAFHWSFATAAFLTACAAAASLLIRDSDAAATLVKRLPAPKRG
jgi:EmrB/QacA subfamily drug resistance transporter